MRRSRSTLALTGLIAIAFLAGCGPRGDDKGSAPGKPAPTGKNNLAVEASHPGIARLAIEVRSGDWAPIKSEINAVNGRAVGGVFVPPGGRREIVVSAFDASGAETHRGADQRGFGDAPSAFAIPVRPTGAGEPFVLQLAAERLELRRTGGPNGTIRILADVFGPDGQPLPPPFDIRYGLNDVRDYKLVPIPDGGIEVVPAADPVKICRLDIKVIACRFNTNCTALEICTDPWVAISASGSHTCAITRSEGVFCWGSNADGQLGSATQEMCGATPCSKRPVLVSCPPGAPCRFKHVAAGPVRTCAIDTNGDAWCWGFGSTSHVRLQATLANATVKFTSMAVGFAHVCAISERNDLWCSGENHFGQIGLPRATQAAGVGVTTPVRILVPMRFRRVVAGVNHTCAILTDNSMACFGDNRERQLTSPSAPPFQAESGCTCTSQPVFQQFGVNVPVEHAAAGPAFTCARVGFGDTRCWGIDAFGLGFATSSPASRLAAGGVHLCGVVNQAAMCMGNGFFGQVGNGSMGFQSTPVQVTPPPSQYTEIAAGAAHSCGLTPDGTAHCWGANGAGQLGIGTTSLGSLVPVRVAR